MESGLIHVDHTNANSSDSLAPQSADLLSSVRQLHRLNVVSER